MLSTRMPSVSASGATTVRCRSSPAHALVIRCPSSRVVGTHIRSSKHNRPHLHHVAHAQLVQTPDLSTELVSTASTSGADYHDVDEVRGVRVIVKANEPTIQYRVKWKDGSPDTWEVADDIADNLIRDFDDRWWTAAKKADDEALAQMLSFGKDVLAQVVDENRRSALHFAAGLGNVKAVQLLLEAGADIDLQDKEGFTPLHMAAGYMRTNTMNTLLKGGASPTLKDNSGRDIATLVDGLKEQLGLNPAQLPRRMALEEVTNNLLDAMYEEVVPKQILEMREVDGGRQYLVQFEDGSDDEWLAECHVSEQLVQDWDAGLELADASAILDYEQRGTARKFLLRWEDGRPDTWEPEEHVSESLLRAYIEQHPELGRKKRKAGAGKKGKSSKRKAAAVEESKQPVGVA